MSARSSTTSGRLRIAVIGAQTAEPESANPYTVYRTAVTYQGQCFERLVRYRQFLWFYKNLKVRDKSSVRVSFPKRKWTRKASLEDDVIEERQVKLNEIMTELARKELSPQSERCLMKLLKIGQHDDGTGRASDVSYLNSSLIKSERGCTLDVVHEEEEAGEKDQRKSTTTHVGGSATLVASSVAFPAISSNATTVLTEEERSVIGSQRRSLDFELEDELADSSDHPRSALRKSTSSIPPSSYSDMVLNRPQLKASHSLPSSRPSKRVGLSVDTQSPPSGPATLESAQEHTTEEPLVDGSLSPEKKYRAKISTQLSTISRLLSESEAETEDMESSRSIQAQAPLALTA